MLTALRIFIGRKLKFFWSISEFVFWTYKVRKNVFFENFLWKHKMQLWRTPKKLLDKKLTLFSSKSNSDKKTIFLSKNFLSLHWSHRHVDCGFDSLIEVFLVKCQKFLTQSPKRWKNLDSFSEKCFSSKCFWWNIESSFGNPAEFVLEQTEFFAR